MRADFLPRGLPVLLTILRRSLPAVTLSLWFAATTATAATTTFSVGLDTDNTAATGCMLATVNGPIGGIEQVATTVVATSATGASVIRLERTVCVGGTLGAPVVYDSGIWPVGLGNGTGGSAVIETSIPLSLLPAAGAMRAVVISDNGSGGQDATASFALALAPVATAPVVPVPLSPWLVLPLSLLLLGGAAWWRRRHRDQTALLVLLVFVAGSGLVWAASVIRDGAVGDWTGVAPAVTDVAGDASVNADIVAVFTQQDASNLHFRIDADVRKDAAANQAPVVSAGTAQTITLPALATLSGSATDDGLPNPPATVTYAWTKVSGPGTVTFGNAANAATAASFSVAGSYVLRLTASDSALSASADVTITANPTGTANQTPVVSAGSNQSITLPASATLAGTATDDGLPNPPGTLTTTWSFVSGPVSGVVFGNPAAPGTSATFAAPGTYVLRLTASDGALSASSTVQITVADGTPQMAAIADRTAPLGSRVQVLLEARDGNANDVLTYALTTAPAGASLNPAPLIDWVPTAAQLGPHTFTARVTDINGNAATTTFTVTVTHVNQPPQLAPQASLITPVGTAFARTLTASDPDAGDVLTFALVAGPSGMTLNGASLNWSTSGRNPGDYGVTVRVTDAAGLSDQKTFTVTLQQSAPAPLAKDDSYEARLGQTLTIPAAGVLGNDVSYSGNPLSAIKLSDPDKGTLDAFNADGGFTYTAPATLPPAPGLNPVVSWRLGLGSNTQFALAADFNHDGVVDFVSNYLGDLRAQRGSDGSQLWQFDPSITTNANLSGCQIQSAQYALGDVTGSGDIYLFGSANCDIPTHSGFPDRYFAVNASQILPGDKVATRWKSARLSQPHPGAYATNASPTLPDPPITPFLAASANGSVPTLAKLTAGGSTKLLTRFLAASTFGYYYDTPNSGHLGYAACRTITGLPADEGVACKATFVIDAASGAIDQVLTAPNPADEYVAPRNSPTEQNIPIVADLDGDGQVEIISGGDVWKRVGGVWTLAWQAQFDAYTGPKKSFEPSSAAVADLDGDGKAEVVFHLLANYYQAGGIYIFNHDGSLRRKIPISTNVSALLSIADVDGDGAPEILVAADSFLYAYRADGALLWGKRLPDILGDVVPPVAPAGAALPLTSDSQLYVYDLDLDGVPEVIVQGTRRLFILNGRTGAELWSIDTESDGFFQAGNPLLVDADGDGHIDILVHVRDRWNCTYGGGPVACLGSAMRISGGDHNWAPGPKVQNQLNFRPAAVDADARILYDASVRRDFRQQIQQGTVIDPRLAQSTAFTYKANDGIADSPLATVFIDIKPPNRPPVITSTPPAGLLSVTPYTRRVYTITATDPDPGDTVHFEFVSSNFDTTYYPAPTVDSATGGVDIYSGPCGSYGGACNFGRVLVIVAAVDSHGARTEQSFFVDITYVSVAVPNVIGQPLPAAGAVIEAASLTPLVVTELFATQPAGTVIGQDPPAGAANIPRSATVKLTVSKGPQPVLLPFVVGQSLAAANAQLTGAGLTVNVSTRFSTTIPAGEIMSQSPVAGTELSPATAPPVNLTVSAGGPLPAPIASVVLEPGPGPMLRLAGDELQYKAVAILTDGTSADVTLTAAWSSSVTSVATVSTAGVGKAIAAGATAISASLSGKTGQGTLNVVARALGDNTPPTAAITSPADGGSVTGPTPIVGTASDANFLRYELAIALAGDATYTLIAEGTTAVTNGTLGTFDPTVLQNGQHTVRLTVYDRAENSTQVERTLVVEGSRKIGLFTVAYTDLALPSAGVPVAVTRTYDSRDKTQGDFGVGWRLGVQTLRLQTNRILGTGWLRTVSGPSVSLSALSEHRVSLTLSDGTVEQFDLQLSPTSNLGSLDFTRVSGLAPRSGTLGTLEYLGNPDLLIVDDGATTVLVDDTTLDTFDPKLFRYTSIDGQRIEIHRLEGVKKVIDRNANSATFGPEGIVHSNGQSIRFVRDAKGRVVEIVAPNGSAQAYAYDGNGDLAYRTDATGGRSSYKYDRRHNLIEIADPSGRGGARSEYDDQGRLTAVIDAAGHRVAFAHNVDAGQEVITDRRGNVVRIQADADGNVTRQEAAVTIDGTLVTAVTTKAYDARGNETSVVDADGRRAIASYDGPLPTTQVADPGGLNLTTSYAYNAKRDPTRLTDPAGRLFDLSYDAAGNLTAATTPLNGTTSATPNAQGRAVERIDALGNRTTMNYDGAGRLTREEVFQGSTTLLRRTDSAYDANGNRIRATTYRTIDAALTPLVTDFGYDAANRVVSVRDPAGGTTRVEYDAAGRVTARIDALSRRTTLLYDALGRLQGTTYPDGSSEVRGYDASGNLVQETDRAGRTTHHGYDELNRRVRTTYSDGTVVQTVLSPGGRVAATIDTRGNRTDYSYDAAGRLVEWTLPAVVNGTTGMMVRPRMTRTLDALGAATTATDPNGRVTTFQYDASGRMARVTFPDGSSQQRSYDALGRVLRLVNEEGQVTDFGYDALGRLVSQSGLAGQGTYAYDEAGNLLAQTDALGRVTRFRYDTLGRLIERRYPGGEAERYTYNAVGNLVSRTDANGRLTTFASDEMDRIVRVIPFGAEAISYTYTADGQRASATDARGTTTYAYDALGRLVAVTMPDGASLGYGYDAGGNVNSLASPAATIGYAYDALNRLIAVTAPEGTTRDDYDLAGNRVRRTAANGVRTDMAFDLRDRPTLISHTDPANAVLASFANTFSAAGRRTRTVEPGGVAEDFGYDSLGRLVSHTRVGAGAFAHSYAYDAVGNRTGRVRDGAPTSYSYDVNDRLLSEGPNTYAYDANGNLVSRTAGTASVQYGYDAFNRMITHAAPTGVTQYGYDVDGGQVLVDRPTEVTRRLVAHRHPSGLAQVVEERSSAGALMARYTAGRESLAMTRDGAIGYYLRDVLGSTRSLANSNAVVTDTYRYDAYGNSVGGFGSTANPLRYAGERLDADSGLYQLRARQLDSSVGRFTTRDPFPGRPARPKSLHRYQYADDDPVNFTDPTGRESLAGLIVAQAIDSMVERAELFTKVRMACSAYGKVRTARLMLGLGSIVSGAIASLQGFEVTNDGKGNSTGWNSGAEVPLLTVQFADGVVPSGTLKKFELKAAGGGGKAGVKLALEVAQRPSVELQAMWPPPEVQFSGGFTGAKVELAKIEECGGAVGEVFLEPSFKGVSSLYPALSVGFAGALDMKVDLFNGSFSWGFPMFAAEFASSGFKVSFLGFALAHGW